MQKRSWEYGWLFYEGVIHKAARDGMGALRWAERTYLLGSVTALRAYHTGWVEKVLCISENNGISRT